MRHLAAGLLEAIIAVDLLPDMRDDGASIFVIITFADDAVLIIALSAFADWLETRRYDGCPSVWQVRQHSIRPFTLLGPW